MEGTRAALAPKPDSDVVSPGAGVDGHTRHLLPWHDRAPVPLPSLPRVRPCPSPRAAAAAGGRPGLRCFVSLSRRLHAPLSFLSRSLVINSRRRPRSTIPITLINAVGELGGEGSESSIASPDSDADSRAGARA